MPITYNEKEKTNEPEDKFSFMNDIFRPGLQGMMGTMTGGMMGMPGMGMMLPGMMGGGNAAGMMLGSGLGGILGNYMNNKFGRSSVPRGGTPANAGVQGTMGGY
jgi:hypothetical protein